MKKAIFFDRDGILNKSIIIDSKPYSPRTLKEFKINYFLKKYINFFKKKNFLIIVITNQPDVGSGLVSKNLVVSFNKKLKREFFFNSLYVCYDTDNKSFFKKPNPGMLFLAKKKHKIDMSKSYFVGDRWKDMEASHRAGVRGLFVDFNYKEKKPVKYFKKFSSLYKTMIYLKKNL
jgi:D-glycero-D-manno-heptose 1,7-bisphosphate phosphatase